MKITKLIFILFILVTLKSYSQNNINVANINEYNEAVKTATPGTTIILKNGIWENVHLKAYGKGEEGNPIVIKAEKPGEVIITGDSKLQIYGEYVVVQGLWFKDGKPTSKSVVSFKKDSKIFANNCRFTHNTISYYNPEDSSAMTHWVDLWGKNNRVDHNNFTGKTNYGTTLVVWLKGEAHTENNHLIDANHFGSRPELGTNGGETIRIGTSKNSKKSSKTIVEKNTFKNCDGEIEIISNKSCDNIYRNNLFLSSKGALTLRHGNNALVENNVFIGNDIKQTGGIRVINEGHTIQNNLMIGLKGTGNRSPLSIMYGVPNSPLNRYEQVKNVNIQNNTLINCSAIEFATQKDDEKTLAPINTIFANNLISNTSNTPIIKTPGDISGIKFFNNIAETTASFDTNLFQKENISWTALRSLPMPNDTNENLKSNYTDTKTPTKDIVGANRVPFVVGAFNLNNTKYPKALTIKSGPYWKPKIIIKKQKIKETVVEPGNNTLYKALKKATPGSIFKLKSGIYYFEKEHKINTNITIIGEEGTILQSSKKLETPFKSFFKINENTSLNLKNISLDGDINNIKYAIISPSEGLNETYNLFIDNCKFINFENPKGAVIKAYTNTTADTISIINSTFSNNFRALNFQSSKNTPGLINANLITINNTTFKNIEQYAIKYSKSVNLSNLNAPNNGKLLVTNSIFSKVNNIEKGKIIDVKNIPEIKIKNSVFQNSNNIVNPINLKGYNSSIENCLVYACGKIKATKGAIAKNILYKSPKWEDNKKFIPSKKSILLKANNNIETIGLLH